MSDAVLQGVAGGTMSTRIVTISFRLPAIFFRFVAWIQEPPETP